MKLLGSAADKTAPVGGEKPPTRNIGGMGSLYLHVSSPRIRLTGAIVAVLGLFMIYLHTEPAVAHEQADAAASGVEGSNTSWSIGPSTQQVLLSDDLQQVLARLQREPGFLGAYPTPGSDTYTAHWSGETPLSALRRSEAGRLIEHVDHTPTRTLLAKAAGTVDAATLGELEGAQVGTGSVVPAPVQGIGPGGPIRMQKADATGQLGTYACSASYLFRNSTTNTYYLATAGHCLLDSEVKTSTENPDARARSVQLCYADCINNFVGLGKYVELRPGDAYPGYHPVAWAEQNGVGKDFGLIEIPHGLNGLLRPRLWQWGGPTGFKRPSTGTPLVHYGFGVGLGQATPTQGRIAATVLSSKEGGHGALGWANGGDSGSAFGTGALRTGEMLIGDGAGGTVTHAVIGVGLPIWFGTDLEYGLERAHPSLGFTPQLVTEKEAIEPGRPAPSSSPSPEPTSSSPSPTPVPSSAEPSPSSSPTPTPTSEPSPSPSPTPPGNEDPTVSERHVTLRASKDRARSGEQVRLRGSVAGESRCFSDTEVKLLARRSASSRFRIIGTTQSNGSGDYTFRVRQQSSRSYRTVVPATAGCSEARSRIVKIRITD